MAETGRAELEDQHLVELRKLELAATREQSEVELRNQREQLAVAALHAAAENMNLVSLISGKSPVS